MMQTVTNKHPTATHTREHTEQLEKSANLAFDKVKTEFFLYLTADTIIDEHNIENLLKIFLKYESVGLSSPVHLGSDKTYLGNYSCHPINRFLSRNKDEKNVLNH